MAGKLANMHSMLTLDAWKRWPLKVKVFSEDVWKAWNTYTNKKGVPALPTWITVELDLEKDSLKMPQSLSEGDASSDQNISEPVLTSQSAEIKSKVTTKKTSKKEKIAGLPQVSGGVPNLDILDGEAISW